MLVNARGNRCRQHSRRLYRLLACSASNRYPHALEKRRYFEDEEICRACPHPYCRHRQFKWRCIGKCIDAYPLAARTPIAVLIVVPTLDGGAADAGAVELVRILAGAGHRAIVVSRAGRLVADVTTAGGEFVPLDVSSNNPVVILRSAFMLVAIGARAAVRLQSMPSAARRLERVHRRAAVRHSVCDQLVQRIPRTEYLQASVQRHHGARRPCHRIERANRAADQRSLRHALGKDHGGAVQYRSGALQSGKRHARAHRGDACRLGRHSATPR